MKRGGSLRRLTPLRSYTELARGGRINPVSRRRQEQQKIRTVAERVLGRDGTQGECARCRTVTYVNGHELRRGSWRDHTRPDCLLCVSCNSWAAQHVRIACWTGWAISAKWPHDPTLENGQARDLYGDTVIFEVAA